MQELTKQLGDRLVLLPAEEIENPSPEEAFRRQVEVDRNIKQNPDLKLIRTRGFDRLHQLGELGIGLQRVHAAKGQIRSQRRRGRWHEQ